jgi:uncharacterized protein (DUF433 family)
MSIVIQTESPPLRLDEGGVIRVGASRVLLEAVIHEHLLGKPPEAIVEAYPTAALADIYAVISYYLNHQAEVEEYLREREAAARATQARIESTQGDLGELRERIRAARAAQQGRP